MNKRRNTVSLVLSGVGTLAATYYVVKPTPDSTRNRAIVAVISGVINTALLIKERNNG